MSDLLPIVQKKLNEFKKKALADGYDFLVTCTYRDFATQDKLFAQGRTAAGSVVTNAKAGQSLHNWRCAFDIVPLVHGKAVWDNSALWSKLGQIGVSCGLEWGGNWAAINDRPHFQYTLGYTWQDFQAGVVDLTKFNVALEQPKTIMDNEIKTFVPVGETSHDNGTKRVVIEKTTGKEHHVMATLFGEQMVTFTTEVGDIIFSNEGYSGNLINELYTVKEI